MNTEEVILEKSGKLITAKGYSVSDPLTALAAQLRLEDGFSLRGVVRMLRQYPELQRLSQFAPDLAGHAQETPASPADLCLERLEFSRVVEIIGAPEPPRLEVYHILRGCTGDFCDMEIKGWRVETLLDVPLRIGALRHIVFGDAVHTFRFETVCTLFDFIDGIVWQLAFHGAPQECALRR